MAQLVIIPRVIQRIDMRANMYRHEQRVIRHLVSTGALGAGGIITAVLIHQVGHAVTLRRKRPPPPTRNDVKDSLTKWNQCSECEEAWTLVEMYHV
jgi:hypothetical protein